MIRRLAKVGPCVIPAALPKFQRDQPGDGQGILEYGGLRVQWQRGVFSVFCRSPQNSAVYRAPAILPANARMLPQAMFTQHPCDGSALRPTFS